MSFRFNWREASTANGTRFYEGNKSGSEHTAQILVNEPSEKSGVVHYGVRVFYPDRPSLSSMATTELAAKRQADRLLALSVADIERERGE